MHTKKLKTILKNKCCSFCYKDITETLKDCRQMEATVIIHSPEAARKCNKMSSYVNAARNGRDICKMYKSKYTLAEHTVMCLQSQYHSIWEAGSGKLLQDWGLPGICMETISKKGKNKQNKYFSLSFSPPHFWGFFLCMGLSQNLMTYLGRAMDIKSVSCHPFPTTLRMWASLVKYSHVPSRVLQII